MTNKENNRWEAIKATFIKNKTLKGLGENDRMAQVVALLSEFVDGLKGIKQALNK